MASCGPKWSQIVLNGPKWSENWQEMSENKQKCSREVWNGVKMAQYGPIWPKNDCNGQKWSLNGPNDPLVQMGSKSQVQKPQNGLK
jgi:hypothetical protein